MENDLLARLALASLSGSAGALLVYFIGQTIPRLPGAARCWLWWMVCLKFLLDLCALPALPVAVLPRSTTAVPVAGQPEAPGVNTLPKPLQRSASHPAIRETATVATAPAVGVPTEAASAMPSLWHQWPWLLLGIWLVGIGVEIGGQWRALVQLHRLLNGAKREELPLLQDAARRAGLPSVPGLWVLSLPIEPLTVGLRHPGIVLGQGDVNRLSDAELLPILTHECVHLRRGDLWLALVPWLAHTLFWFLPFAHLASREFELAREIACDQQTVAVLATPPRAYGELLVKLSSPASALSTPSSAVALSAGYRHLKRRIEMLEVKPYRRRLLLPVLLVAAAFLLPWRLSQGAPPTANNVGNRRQPAVIIPTNSVFIFLPNLDFSKGMKNWKLTAMGSDTEPHPFYTVGVDPGVKLKSYTVGYVKARPNIAQDTDGDGGVLRYDHDATKYRGDRLRWTGYVRGEGVTKKAFLFAATSSAKGITFATSPSLTTATTSWEKRTVVLQVPDDATDFSLGLRLEGGGTAYGSNFTLEVVKDDTPLSSAEFTPFQADAAPPPSNLSFKSGLDGWWNDNPTHDTEQNYTMGIEPTGGQKSDPAAFLKNKVAQPKSYGTIARNASAVAYRGKRIRLSAYLKSKDAQHGSLWYVLQDESPKKASGNNGDTSGKLVRGTQNWTRFSYEFDVPPTATTLSFGIESEGTGTVWVENFEIEEVKAAR